MNIPFLDSNPEILKELKAMDHQSRDYRKTLRKVFLEIGGPAYLLTSLKATEEGNRLRRKYYRSLAIGGAFLLLMFLLIPIAVLLTGGREISQFNSGEQLLFIGFIILEAIAIVLTLVFSFRGQAVLFEGTSYLIDQYESGAADVSGKTLGTFAFEKTKANRKAIILSMVFIFFISFAVPLGNGLIGRLQPVRAQDFSKAGMTITLTKDFREQEVVSQTATFTSAKHVVICIKDDFQTIRQAGLQTSMPLKDYAKAVAQNNSISATVGGSDSRPVFTYSRQANGKEYTYWTTVYRGSDAFWTFLFVCESKNYAASEKQFAAWADTVKVA